ncbi:hypothetical protein [Porphyromonas sp.]|uniref:hypothetical protein n=1 Tax=Porphyromonas sp. TaxID=1924944 RepID=UPI0026DA9146|nr:hypothetical protein [Porphyromonas sp.]MDO4770620.1 hypothetical protein [Porphyromonas sp.]
MSLDSWHNYKCVRGNKPCAHFFNPGYEASVALGDKSYTPSGMVQMMRRDLWELPYYYAGADDIVLNPEHLPPQATLSEYTLAPWGWAPELKYGKLASLVSFSYDEIRLWSSRQNTYALVERLITLFPIDYDRGFLPYAITDQSIPQGLDMEKKYVLKEEFSSSGRGVVFVRGSEVSEILSKRQNKSANKRIYLENFYSKVGDRGYEFYRDAEGHVTYVGPSDFKTIEGRYVGNVIEPAESIHRRWRQEPTSPSHDTYVNQLLQALDTLQLGSYQGPIGIDTIVYEDARGLHLHPCIEINIRPTMGWLAISLAERYLPEGMNGRFELVHFPSADALQRDLVPLLASTTPLYQRDISVQSLSPGTYPLNTLTPQSRFAALLVI